MQQTQETVRGGYKEIEKLSDPGGAIAIITERVGRGTFSVAFFREFEREPGLLEKTNFFASEHMDSLIRIATTARKRMDTLKAQTKSSNRKG